MKQKYGWAFVIGAVTLAVMILFHSAIAGTVSFLDAKINIVDRGSIAASGIRYDTLVVVGFAQGSTTTRQGASRFAVYVSYKMTMLTASADSTPTFTLKSIADGVYHNIPIIPSIVDSLYARLPAQSATWRGVELYCEAVGDSFVLVSRNNHPAQACSVDAKWKRINVTE